MTTDNSTKTDVPADIPTLTESQPARSHVRSSMMDARRDTEEFVKIAHDLDSSVTVMVPEGVQIIGSIHTNGKAAVYVKGEVVGSISAGNQSIYVEEGARVRGQLNSDVDIYVAGTVDPDTAKTDAPSINTPQRVFLASTGRVNGDIAYGSIRIYGGIVAGRMVPAGK